VSPEFNVKICLLGPSNYMHKQPNKRNAVDLLLTVLVRGSGAPVAFLANVLIIRSLGAQAFGVYMVLLSAAYLLGGVAVFGTDRVLVREIAIYWNNDPKDNILLVGRWGVSRVLLFAGLGAILVFLWFQSKWANTGYDEFSGILTTSLLVPASALLIIISAFLTGMGNVKTSQAVEPIRNSLLLAGLTLALCLGVANEIRTILIVQVVSFLLATIAGWWWIRYRIGGPALTDYWRRKLDQFEKSRNKVTSFRVSSWHFFLGTAGVLVLNRVDVLVVNALSDSTTAGYYGAAVRVGQIVALIGLAGSIWLQPKVAHYYNNGEREALLLLLKQGGVIIVTGTAIVVAFLFVWADFIVSWLGPGFEVVAIPLRWVGLGYLFWSMAVPFYAFLLMAGEEALIARVLWIQVFVGLALHVALVPSFGVIGATWAWTGGMVLISAITMWCGIRRLNYLSINLGQDQI